MHFGTLTNYLKICALCFSQVMKYYYIVFILSLYHLSVFANIDLSCSVFLYGVNDWNITNKHSNCMNMVSKVRDFCGGTSVNFVITQHWLDYNNDYIPDRFCFIVGDNCKPVDKYLVNEFTKTLSICFDHAIKKGFKTIAITPHLDDGMRKGGWRNVLDMHPTKKNYGFSYSDIMLSPIATALKRKNIKVRFALQGEMNKMIVKYPTVWLSLSKTYKKQIGGKDTKIGISMNFNKLCGMNACSKRDNIDFHELRKLFSEIDFIGISSYPSMNTNIPLDEFQNCVFIFEQELSVVGISLRNILKNPNKEFHFSEFGIGGGTCGYMPGCVAVTPGQALKTPYYGIHGPYSKQRDPWNNNVMRNFIRYYYKQTVKWVSQKTGPVYRVHYIFIWNVASWDITGIYHPSTTSEGSYRDIEIVKTLKNWNNHRKLLN